MQHSLGYQNSVQTDQMLLPYRLQYCPNSAGCGALLVLRRGLRGFHGLQLRRQELALTLQLRALRCKSLSTHRD